MDGLTPLIEKQLAREAAAMNEEALLLYPPVPGEHSASTHGGPSSRTQTPEPSNFGSSGSGGSLPPTPSHGHAAAAPPPQHLSSPLEHAQQVFDHNALLGVGGFGASRSMALVAARSPGLSPAEEREWTTVSALGADWWRAHFGRSELVPWSDATERAVNSSLAQISGSSARGLEGLDFATLRGTLEKLGSPPGYVHVQAMGAFWHEWHALCTTVKRVLPLWSQSHPARVIHGWCSRAACSALLVDPVTGLVRPPGSFAVRLSETQVGHIAVGFVDDNGRLIHTLVLVRPAENDFVLRLTDGDRAYPNLVELLKQCRPFQTLAPSGLDKDTVLGVMGETGNAAAGGEDHLSQQQQQSGSGLPPHPLHVSTPSSGFSSGQFASFPNNALGGGVGLATPPTPGSHGQMHHHHAHTPSASAAGGLSQPMLVGSQSHGVGPSSSPFSHHMQQHQQQQQHRLPHPQSFPSLASMAQALPPPSPQQHHHAVAAVAAAHSNPNAEGQPPVPSPAHRGPSPAGAQQEGAQLPAPPGGAV